MKYLLVLTLIFTGCSSEKKEEFDFARFSMECKKLAQKLKVDFIVEGTSERPGCTVGQKDDTFGGLSGAHFTSREAIQGALRALWLQRTIPLHDKLQACNKKCEPMRGSTSGYLSCWRPCGQAAGYYEEDEL